MARMMDRMMVESLQPFGFARMTTRRGGDGRDKNEPPRDGLQRTERSEARRERAKQQPDTHMANGTRHPPTQGKVSPHMSTLGPSAQCGPQNRIFLADKNGPL